MQENAPGIRPVALDLAGIPDIDDHDVVALRGLDGVGRTHRLDLRVGFVDHRLDAAVDGLGHFVFTSQISVIPGASKMRTRNDGACFYRTSSFIAPSRPSMVIGNMRSENSRRMMVVDSE